MKAPVLALIGICLLTFFAGLGAPAITDSDEAFYAEGAREMVERGDWLTPHFNYLPRFEKPILYYWLAALGYQLVGVSEAAARAPSALSGLGLVLVTFACGRRWYDPRTGWLAGLITATSFGYIAMARQALPDLTLAFFVTVVVWALMVAALPAPLRSDPLPTEGRRRRWVMLAGAAAGAAVLTKGPVGVALPALIVGPLAVWEYGMKRTRPLVGVGDVLVGVGVFAAITVPWYLWMTLVHGVGYLDRFFVTENLERFATARYNDPRPVWYYLPIVWSGLLPWSPFMLLWVPAVWRVARSGLGSAVAGVRLVWWAAAPLLFFTVSVGKQPRYVLPLLPPLAVLLAVAIHYRLERPGRDRLFTLCTVFAGVAVLGVAGLAYRASPLFVEWEGTPAVAGSAALIAVAGAGVLATLWRRSWLPAALVVTSVVVSLAAHYVVLASPGAAPVERLALMLREASAGERRASRYRIFNRNLIFYSRMPLEELSVAQAARDLLGSPTPVYLVLPAEEIPRLEATGATIRPLGHVRYFNTGSVTLRMLVDPDPARQVRRVVLVSNQ